MRHGRHHAPLHEAQLSRQIDRGPAARPARGVLRGAERPSGSGGGRPAEGHPVQDRLLCAALEQPAQDLSSDGQGRHGPYPRRNRADGECQASGVLYRRRRRQFRAACRDAAARTRAAHRLSHHLDPDGARRLSGLRPALARHARHARHLRGQSRDARMRRDDQYRRALRRPHHGTARCLLAVLQAHPCGHRSVLDQQER